MNNTDFECDDFLVDLRYVGLVAKTSKLVVNTRFYGIVMNYSGINYDVYYDDEKKRDDIFDSITTRRKELQGGGQVEQ